MRITASPVEKIFRETLPEKLPHYEVREQQIEMALMVERALLHETNLLAEAGTGTGKSFAYLIPIALDLLSLSVDPDFGQFSKPKMA